MRISPRTVDAHVLRREKYQARIQALTTLMSGGDVPIAELRDRSALLDDIVKAYGVYDRTQWFLSVQDQLDSAPSMRDLLTELLDESLSYSDEDRRAFRIAISTGEFPVELSEAEATGLTAFLDCVFSAEMRNPFETGTIDGVRTVLSASAAPPQHSRRERRDAGDRLGTTDRAVIGYDREDVFTRWMWAEYLGQGFHTHILPLEQLTFYNDREWRLDCLTSLGEVYELLSGAPLSSLIPEDERTALLEKMRRTPIDSPDKLLNSPDGCVEEAHLAGLVTDGALRAYREIENAARDVEPGEDGASPVDADFDPSIIDEESSYQEAEVEAFLAAFAERDAYCASFRTLASCVLDEKIALDVGKLAASMEIVIDAAGISRYEDDDAFFPAYLLLAQAQARILPFERRNHVPSIR